MSNKGILTVVSGPSGVGKGTICKALVEKYPDEYALSISVTSRLPRETEVEGREYFFKTKDEFEAMIEMDLLLEHAQYVDNYYGTPVEWVNSMLDKGVSVILEIDCQGGFQVASKLPETVLIFIMPPSMEELHRRLKGRGTESEEQIRERISRADEEIRKSDKYNYVIINDDVEKSMEMLHNIIQLEKKKLTGEI